MNKETVFTKHQILDMKESRPDSLVIKTMVADYPVFIELRPKECIPISPAAYDHLMNEFEICFRLEAICRGLRPPEAREAWKRYKQLLEDKMSQL